ncbi:hypothetical protein M0R72_19655 [Candidatus Pacearchaeota archaeon]|jgi:hypothetical protein|nr:hypothetical protein [Candidatus Pacearchaeota archaeon]
MKDIGMFRAYLAELHSMRNRCVKMVDNRDLLPLKNEIRNMQMVLNDMNDLIIRQEDA